MQLCIVSILVQGDANALHNARDVGYVRNDFQSRNLISLWHDDFLTFNFSKTDYTFFDGQFLSLGLGIWSHWPWLRVECLLRTLVSYALVL